MDTELMSCNAELNTADDEIKILPIGNVSSQKGSFIVDEESFSRMKEAFIKRGLDIVVDYEHQTLEGVQAPAGGWIKDIYIKANAIAAKVEWTPRAKEYIQNKEYRYLSPVVQVRKTDRKAIILHSVALTNTPAIDHMFPIINRSGTDKGVELMELLQELSTLLGIDKGATQEQIIAKLKEVLSESPKGDQSGGESQEAKQHEIIASKEVLQLLGLNDKATEQDVTSRIMMLKNPAGQIDALAFQELKMKLERREADELVSEALKSGKITAAQKAWAEEYALKAPEGFKEYLKNAGVVVPMGELQKPKQGRPVSDSDMLVCKMIGVSADDVKKYGEVEA